MHKKYINNFDKKRIILDKKTRIKMYLYKKYRHNKIFILISKILSLKKRDPKKYNQLPKKFIDDSNVLRIIIKKNSILKDN